MTGFWMLDAQRDADGLLIDNDTLTRCGMHQYNLKVHIRNGAALFVRVASGNPDTTGWLTLQALLISTHDSSSIIGSGSGHKGGYLNSHPWGYGPGGGGAGGVNAQVLGGSPGIGDPYLPQTLEGSPGSFYFGAYTAVAELATQRIDPISVQPNPVRDAAVISVADAPAHVKVYDVAGRMVMYLCLQEHRTRVRFGALGRGVYFLMIDNEGSRPRKLVLIE